MEQLFVSAHTCKRLTASLFYTHNLITITQKHRSKDNKPHPRRLTIGETSSVTEQASRVNIVYVPRLVYNNVTKPGPEETEVR